MRTRAIFACAIFAVGLLFSTIASAKDVVDHGPFDALLSEYVDGEGRVDYAKLKKNKDARKKLTAYLKKIGDAKVKGSKDARLAFYINAYNAHVINSVVEKYPLESVMKSDGFFKKEKHEVAGKKMTLDALEHKLIRKKFAEPRIHFALVCAAKSCPRLRKDAYTEKNLEKSLEAAAKEFIPKATTVEGKTVKTSQLFNWFGEDFKKKSGSVEKFLAKYLPDHADLLKSGDAKLEFTHYDWALNKQ